MRGDTGCINNSNYNLEFRPFIMIMVFNEMFIISHALHAGDRYAGMCKLRCGIKKYLDITMDYYNNEMCIII